MNDVTKTRLPIGWLVFLLLAVAFLFGPSLPYPFLNWDDEEYILRNPWLLNLTLANVAGVFRYPYFSNYHPLTMISYMADFALFGYQPWGYRLMNIAGHVVAVLVGARLLLAMGASRPIALGAMVLFAIHPLRVESVVWISERKDILCAMFYTGALLAWVRARGAQGRALAMVLFVAALLSKAMAVSLPVVIVLHDLLLGDRRRAGERWPWYVAMIALSASFSWLNVQAQEEAIHTALPLWERLATALYAPWHYARATVLPAWISPLYPVEFRPTRSLAAAAFGAGFSLGALAVAMACVRRAPGVAFGLLAAAAALAPVSGIVGFGAAWAADRYSYIPTLLLFAGLARELSRFVEGRCGLRFLIYIPFIGFLMLFVVVAKQRVPDWRSSAALWERVLAVYPESAKAAVNLAHARAFSRDSTAEPVPVPLPMAQPPNPVTDAGTAVQFLAGDEMGVHALLVQGRVEDALGGAARLPDPRLAVYWRMRVLAETGRLDEAAPVARELLAMQRVSPEHRAQGALALARAGDLQAAAVALDALGQPTMSGPFAWGVIAERTADPVAAERAARRALAIFPAAPAALQVLVHRVLLPAGREAEAARILNRAARHPAAAPMVRVSSRLTAANLDARAGRIDNIRLKKLYEETLTEAARNASAPDLVYLAFLAESAEYQQAAGTGLAVRLYREALEKDPRSTTALLNLATLQLSERRKGEGVELLERLLELEPENSAARENLKIARESMELDRSAGTGAEPE